MLSLGDWLALIPESQAGMQHWSSLNKPPYPYLRIAEADTGYCLAQSAGHQSGLGARDAGPRTDKPPAAVRCRRNGRMRECHEQCMREASRSP